MAKLLTFGRVLNPDSKIGTFNEKNRCLFDVASSDDPAAIHRALDCLNAAVENIQKRVNHKITGGRAACDRIIFRTGSG
jgi:hypothetical protein